MADTPNYSKTEAPTPRRREQARKKGQIAQSVDLSSGLLLMCCALMFWLGASTMGAQLVQFVRTEILDIGRTEQKLANASGFAGSVLGSLAQIIGPLMGVLVVVALGSRVLQGGLTVSANPLTPDWGRLSPAKGLQRLFSIRSSMRGLMVIFKVLAAVALVGWLVKGQLGFIALSGHQPLGRAVDQTWTLAVNAALALAAALILLGLLDFLFQRWRHEEDLKMSRQEVKEEQKQDEGDPQVRARIKRLQREVAQQRMLKDIPNATVVITNPTHLAIALQYDRHSMAAPKVVAKGANLLAKNIVRIAKKHDIPVLERKPVAQALYAAVEVGQPIPESLFMAMAEILAYVYRLRPAA